MSELCQQCEEHVPAVVDQVYGTGVILASLEALKVQVYTNSSRLDKRFSITFIEGLCWECLAKLILEGADVRESEEHNTGGGLQEETERDTS